MYEIITKPLNLFILFLVNFIGSIYGFYWYKGQLLATTGFLKVFVPDSPTASLLFAVAIFMLLIKKHRPLIMIIACAWLIKYGLWAVFMNTHFFLIGGNYTFTNFHLTISHLGMSFEGLIFIKNLAVFDKIHVLIIIILMIISDIVDYVLGLHPWLFTDSQWGFACISAILLTISVSLYFLFLNNKVKK